MSFQLPPYGCGLVCNAFEPWIKHLWAFGAAYLFEFVFTWKQILKQNFQKTI
jgi:hypothetical protein